MFPLSNFSKTRKKVKVVLIVMAVVWTYVFISIYPHRSRIMRTNVYEESKSISNIKVDTSDHSIRNVSKKTSNSHSSYGHCQSNDFLHIHPINDTSLDYFTKAFSVSQEPVASWLQQEDVFCDGAIQVISNRIGHLLNIKVNPKHRNNVESLAKGGEKIQDVKSQNVKMEDYFFKHGFYEMECADLKTSDVLNKSPYDRLRQLQLVNNMDTSGCKTEDKFTVAIVRGDYANLWNHMFELYGVFLVMMIYNKQPKDVSILFLDGHPACALDRNWEHIFGNVQRVGQFQDPVIYKHLVWGLAENQIPLSKWQNPSCPYVEEFREFVLSQYDIVENAKKLNCKSLTFTFIVRRNQVYHPRNLEGNVQRKIFNELDVIDTLMNNFPGVCIQALLMESIPMRAQLEIISETDVLIGMHGAGMMHTTFLPRHAGVVELFPRDWRKTRKHSIMYQKMSLNWRHIHYGSWENPDPKRDFDERVTIVDENKVSEEVHKIVNQMCNY